MLEESKELVSLTLNPAATPAPHNLLDKYVLRKHGKDAYDGQERH